jgi:catechol 2,3-dioxygenase-like lactoylglutathione lyase family enzyme
MREQSMSDREQRSHIHQVTTVFVPVSDQDRALEFYVGTLGFEKLGDFGYGNGHRWVEVAPRGSEHAIALVSPSEGRAAGGEQTHCALASNDVDADHAMLRAHGVEVDDVVGHTGTRRPGLLSRDVSVDNPQPAQFHFSDPDGNRFLVVQAS